MFRCGFRSFVCLANENRRHGQQEPKQHRIQGYDAEIGGPAKAPRMSEYPPGREDLPSCHDDENQAECAESYPGLVLKEVRLHLIHSHIQFRY